MELTTEKPKINQRGYYMDIDLRVIKYNIGSAYGRGATVEELLDSIRIGLNMARMQAKNKKESALLTEILEKLK